MKSFGLIFIFLLFSFISQAQKTVQTQSHFWWSINTTAQVSNKWSIIADAHIRRTNFMANNSFYFLRAGALYNVNKNFSVAGGYGHMWLANKSGATELFTNEHRIYQQFQLTGAVGKVSTINRLRVEERWIQKIVGGQLTNSFRFTTRFRYLYSINIPVSKNKYVPSINLADELLMQIGKDIVYNPFDQNRLFAGIKQQVTPSLSFDFGYMLVYQQKLSGSQYVKANTLRWYFYWKPDLRKKKKTHTAASQLSQSSFDDI